MSIPSSPKCDNCYNGNSGNRYHRGGCSGCNQCNSTCQTLCQVGYQLITKHPNVGSFPWTETIQPNSDSLSRFITAQNWNKIIQKLNNAEQVGTEKSQGSAGTATLVKSGDLFYPKYYNEIQQKLNGFIDGHYEQVNQNDLITAARMNAIKDSYNRAKFKISVCDICNTGENDCLCNCSCSCACACPCPCSCQCQCSSPCDSPSGN